MKKYLYGLLVCCTMVALPACEDDYEDASSVHVYGENENPPLKGSDANNATASMAIKMDDQSARVVDLNDYADQIQAQLGMSLGDAINGLNDGSVRFMIVNNNRRVWDKTPANAGENTWALSSTGVVCDPEVASVILKFDPAARTIAYNLTANPSVGLIPVTCGFALTDDSSYPVNFRLRTSITVTDLSVIEIEECHIPDGDYTVYSIALGEYAANIDFALGVTPYELAKGLDTASPSYDVFIMDSNGNLVGGEGKYTANGAGYWLDASGNICNWGVDGFTYFIEPDIYDYDAEDYYAHGGYFNVGRAPGIAAGTVLHANFVIRSRADITKTLTIMATAILD